jgi:hypothetical protein
MSIKIVTQPEEFITIESVDLIAVKDLFEEKKIIARIKGLPRGVVLWEGDEEYTAAGNWTNESAAARAAEVVNSDSIKWG